MYRPTDETIDRRTDRAAVREVILPIRSKIFVLNHAVVGV